MKVKQEHVTHSGQTFRFIRLELDAFRGERHRHRQLELTWIEQGAGLRFVGSSVEAFESDDLVLLGPHVPHAWVSAGERAGKPHLATVLQFSPDLIFQHGLPEMGSLSGLVALAGQGLQIEGAARGAMLAVLRGMPQRSSLLRLADLIELLGLLQEHQASLRPILDNAQHGSGGMQADEQRRVDRVLDWIHQHMDQSLTVEAAAALVHVTPAAFSRFFSREVGKSFTAYINDVRCSEASLRLRLSDRPVAVIARECGFETMSHFNRQFRIRTGSTPRDFRIGDSKPRRVVAPGNEGAQPD
ncbi:AraC family transcriptional regulator [Roseateles sp.]|uniref:AraC family transcriptional regulator n=1 Tax=Roseateles sp. TaxID=1971397 RepID=UPI003D100C32